jgi:hypothetical protein
MARCAYCGAETQLFVNGTPVCVPCEGTRQPEMPEGDYNERSLANDRSAPHARNQTKRSP